MPKVGDGRGESGGGETHDGLTWRDDSPENPSGEYKSTPKGKGAIFEGGRMKPFEGK